MHGTTKWSIIPTPPVAGPIAMLLNHKETWPWDHRRFALCHSQSNYMINNKARQTLSLFSALDYIPWVPCLFSWESDELDKQTAANNDKNRELDGKKLCWIQKVGISIKSLQTNHASFYSLVFIMDSIALSLWISSFRIRSFIIESYWLQT